MRIASTMRVAFSPDGARLDGRSAAGGWLAEEAVEELAVAAGEGESPSPASESATELSMAIASMGTAGAGGGGQADGAPLGAGPAARAVGPQSHSSSGPRSQSRTPARRPS